MSPKVFILLRASITALFCGALALSARGEPAIKVVYLSADWCPPCLRLGPRLDDALREHSGGNIGRLDVDMSTLRGHGEDIKWQTVRKLRQQAARNNVSYIWDWYGGYPGLVVVTAADNGEPLTCLTSTMSVDEMSARLQESLILATVTAPGKRRPSGTDCPAPLRPQKKN